jgi:integrase
VREVTKTDASGRERTVSRYDVRYRGPDRRQRTRSFTRKIDAQQFIQSVEVDKRRGDFYDERQARVDFNTWWNRFWSSTVNLRPSTRARDESYVRNHVMPRFGTMSIGDIDHLEVRAWVADLSACGLAPATVQKAHQLLAKSLRAAVEAGLLRANPADNVPLPRIEREEMRFLNPEEIARLANAIGDNYRSFVLLGAYGGLRLGELGGLRRARLDLNAGRVDVAEILVEVRGHHTIGPPKTNAGRRSVSIPRFVAEELETHVDGFKPDDLVFTMPKGGPLRASLFRTRIWIPACVKAGLGEMVKVDDKCDRYDGLRIHDLRHTAVALWIAAGASPREIATRAGHTSVSVVLDRYGHLLPGLEDRVTDALDEMARAAAGA